MKFNIYVPSYKRSDRILTHNLVEYCTYIVRESEQDKYLEAGVNVVAVDDEFIVGIPAVENWLIDNAKEDVICILDDDIKKFFYRLETNSVIESPEVITSEIERLAQIIYDLDLGFLTSTGIVSPMAYNCEFRFSGLPNSMKIINRRKCKSRFNEIDFFNDVDFQLQELLKNRIVLVSNYFYDEHLIDVNDGGSNARKTAEMIYIADSEMCHKWGQYYIASGKGKAGRINVKR